MIGEFRIGETSSLVGRMTDEICKEFKVTYIHMHKGLPSDEKMRLSNPPPRIIEAGNYLKISGEYNKVISVMKVASGG